MVENLDKPQTMHSPVSEGKGLTLADNSLSDMQQHLFRKSTAAVSDVTIVDDSSKPATRQGQLQEFADGFGKTGKLYSDSVNDDARFGKFQERVENIYSSDHKTFMELAKLGDKFTGNPSATGQEVGSDLGKIFAEALSRQSGKSHIDLNSDENKNLMGALSGYMLAARSTFGPDQQQKQVEAMVDALDAQLQHSNLGFVHGVIWGDTKEPAFAVYPPSATYDRHNFLP